jgi:hypothetical protein
MRDIARWQLAFPDSPVKNIQSQKKFGDSHLAAKARFRAVRPLDDPVFDVAT